MKRIRNLILAIVAVTAMLGAIARPASAQPDPSVLIGDVQTMVANLPAALQVTVEGLQAAAQTLADTQSAMATSEAAGAAVAAGGGALVNGTTQFGSLGLGLVLVTAGFQEAVRPVFQTIIDEQNPQAVLDPAHVQALAAALPTILDEVLNGADGFCNPKGGLKTGLAHLLQGNIIDPPLGLGPAFWCYGVVNTAAAGFNHTQGTPVVGVFQFLGISSLVLGAALEPEVSGTVEPALAPVFDGIAPVTGPVVDALGGL